MSVLLVAALLAGIQQTNEAPALAPAEIRGHRGAAKEPEPALNALQTPAAKAGDARVGWGVGFLLVFSGYAAVFSVSGDRHFLVDLQAAALNASSLAVAAFAARIIIIRWLLRLVGPYSLGAHAVVAVLFALIWSWLLYLLTGIVQSGSISRFDVVPFLQGPAQQWQMMQGLFAYAAIAALTVIEHRPARSLLVLDNRTAGYRKRFLLRADGAFLSLTASDIVSVTGADDYAEVVTTHASHLVATTLGDLEAVLDPDRFVRVHRSAIANLDHVKRAEPVGGGRMTLTMSAGRELPVSRAGARLLKDRSV